MMINKGIIRNRRWLMKENDQNKKTKTHHYRKLSINNWCDLKCSGRVSTSCPTSGTRRVKKSRKVLKVPNGDHDKPNIVVGISYIYYFMAVKNEGPKQDS